MKRVLLDLEPPLLQPKVFDGLLEAQFGAAGLQQKISTIRRLLSSLQVPAGNARESRHMVH